MLEMKMRCLPTIRKPRLGAFKSGPAIGSLQSSNEVMVRRFGISISDQYHNTDMT